MPANRAIKTELNRILVTGASGELGAALARHYATPGRTLLLWGRNRDRLAAVAEACRQAGANAVVRTLDLTEAGVAIAAVEEDDRAGSIDLAIFAAGLGDIQTPGDLVEEPAQIVRTGLVNFVTPCAMAAALAGRMAKRREGRIVLIGSVAAFHALPFAAAYAGSKAGMARFAEALRLGVAAYGVRITLVSPGFIDTAAGRKVPGPKPFLMQPSDVATCIAKATEQGQAHVILPWPFALLRIADRILPARLRDRLLLALRPRTD
jgi:short-subunit dehydrogenase